LKKRETEGKGSDEMGVMNKGRALRSQDGREFSICSYDEEHYKAIELISSFPKGRVLDLPAGHGRLSWLLRRNGYRVVAGDIQLSYFQNPEIPIARMDMQSVFPFRDNAFDYAFLIEGPEHVENIYHVFREFARVLKPGGKLVLSCPNYSNIESRLRMLFYGIAEPVTSREQLRTDFKDNPSMVHISRPLYPLLKMALDFAGFDVEEITTVSSKKNQVLLYPFYFLIRLFTAMKGKKGNAKYWIKESNRASVLMGGNALMVMAGVSKGN
jgi:SAM-dependent methyltransferase